MKSKKPRIKTYKKQRNNKKHRHTTMDDSSSDTDEEFYAGLNKFLEIHDCHGKIMAINDHYHRRGRCERFKGIDEMRPVLFKNSKERSSKSSLNPTKANPMTSQFDANINQATAILSEIQTAIPHTSATSSLKPTNTNPTISQFDTNISKATEILSGIQYDTVTSFLEKKLTKRRKEIDITNSFTADNKIVDAFIKQKKPNQPNNFLKFYICQQKDCTFSTTKRFLMLNHHRTVHEINVYGCPTCDCIFSNKMHIASHNNRYHDGFRCNDCGFETRAKTLLVLHEKCHLRKNVKKYPYECVVCMARFTRENLRDEHQRMYH